MFKIAKPKIHKRNFKTRKTLRITRGACTQQSLLDLLHKFERHPRRTLKSLHQFLENEDHKNYVKIWTRPECLISFDTAWEGACVLLRAIQEETSERVRRADMELLWQDLERLRTYITPSIV